MSLDVNKKISYYLSMKALFALIMILSVSLPTWAKPGDRCQLGPLRIAVVDTGFGFQNQGYAAPLCSYGHKDFSNDQHYLPAQKFLANVSVPADWHGHGTNIAGLIEQYANNGKSKYCLVIIKYYSKNQTNEQNAMASVAALKYVSSLNVDVINYSGGGEVAIEEERLAIKKILDQKKIFIAAAGNDGKLIDGKKFAYYPASYDSRITVVGNGRLGRRELSSNYGQIVDIWENGVNQEAYGIKMTGTSQATAIHTGKVVSTMVSCDKRK